MSWTEIMEMEERRSFLALAHSHCRTFIKLCQKIPEQCKQNKQLKGVAMDASGWEQNGGGFSGVIGSHQSNFSNIKF